MNKLKKYLKRFSIVFPLIAIILSFTFCVGAIGDNNNGILVYNITTKYSTTATSNPSTTSGFNTYQYSGTNQVGFITTSQNNDFSKGNRYCTFNLKNTNDEPYLVTIKFVSYYGVSGNSVPQKFGNSPNAWVNNYQYGSYAYFDYSQSDKSGTYTINGGQFTFGLNAGSDVSVVLLGGYQSQLANGLFFNIDIVANPYNTNQDVIDNQNQNTQDILDNQNENADKINGTIDEIFNGDNYEGATDEHDKMDDYTQSEEDVTNFANDNLDSVKSDLWDTNLFNPNVNTPINGFKALSMIFDTFLEDCPSLGFIAKVSISFGILAFVLGLAITIYRRHK